MSEPPDATFIDTTRIGSAGTTVAVKDLIDIAGLPTTAGCRAIARSAGPAIADAACMAGLRAAIDAGEARIVGKTNLSELAMGASGVNEWFGTPRNPLDPELIPGGSSSGSAVAVAAGEAEVGIGSDTGGSVRVPAACCGIVGLKTTHGRVPTGGVLPLAESLDTVGPLGRDVAAVVRGMELLEPGFAPGAPAQVIGRVRVPDEDPRIGDAVDRALAAAGFEVTTVELPGWDEVLDPAFWIGLTEAARNNGALADREPDGLLDRTREAIAAGRELAPREDEGRRFQRHWEAELATAFTQAELLAWPTLAGFPPRLGEFGVIDSISRTMEVNLAGLPALSQPVPTSGPGPVPASLQLVGPRDSDERLVATGAVIESANGAPGRSCT
ncbi:MAG: amidase [Actinobacteria bacterium]|nr:amidase [Actinomycetota bacterium]